MELIAKTAKRLQKLKGMLKEKHSNFSNSIIQDNINLIINFKNELKDIHGSEECSCWHDENNPCGYGLLIQEIESVEND